MLRISSVWLGIVLMGVLGVSAAEPSVQTAVILLETNDADCILHGGKRVSLSLVDHSKTVTVWVDRWYMGVQTPDHTKHVLDQSTPESSLGCSATRAGPQHWTIYSMESS